MPLTNPPIEITALAAMLAASASFQTLIGAATPSDRIFYPEIVTDSVERESGISPLPCAVLISDPRILNRVATQVVIDSGIVGVRLHAPLSQLIAMEAVGRAIALDLMTQATGLALISSTVGTSIVPDPASRAADSDQPGNAIPSIIVTLTYGLRV